MTREEAIQILADLIDSPFLHTWEKQNKALHMAIEALSERTGEWIFNPKDAIELMFTLPKCSECGLESSDCGNFCQNCGADMRGEQNG